MLTSLHRDFGYSELTRPLPKSIEKCLWLVQLYELDVPLCFCTEFTNLDSPISSFLPGQIDEIESSIHGTLL
jgi:hypothetical protein